MKALNRETTMANRRPAAPSPTSIAGTAGSGGRSIFILSFVVFSAPQFDKHTRIVVETRLAASPAACKEDGASLVSTLDCCLLPLELGRPLLQKRRRSFLLILGSAANPKQSSLQIKSFGQRHLHPLLDRLHSVLHRQRSVCDDLSRN